MQPGLVQAPQGAHPMESRAIWQVMQYEGLMGNLQNAIEDRNAAEAQKLIKESYAAYSQLKDDDEAQALIETGYYDVSARSRMCEAFTSNFGDLQSAGTEDDAIQNGSGLDDPILKDPFRCQLTPPNLQATERKYPLGAAGRAGNSRWTSQKSGRAGESPLDSAHQSGGKAPKSPPASETILVLRDAVDNRELCRKITTSQQSLLGILNGTVKPLLPQSRTVLQLRGGGAQDAGYGSCFPSACCSDPRVLKSDDTIILEDGESGHEQEKPKAHDRVKNSWAAEVNAFLDAPVIAFGLVIIDLGSDLGLMATGWVILWWIGIFALNLMVLQQVLEIYLHSPLVKKEILEEDEVAAVNTFWADDRSGNAIRIQRGWTGYVDFLDSADWRDDTGAFITFEAQDLFVFVSDADFEDLVVTSGLAEYFSNPMNDFNCLLLAVCVVFAYGLLPSGGCATLLIILRIAKPTVKMYSRKDKMDRTDEQSKRQDGHHHQHEAPEAEDAELNR